MNSYKTNATFLDRMIRSGHFPAHRFVQRAIATLSGSLFLGFSAAILFAHTQVALAQTESVLTGSALYPTARTVPILSGMVGDVPDGNHRDAEFGVRPCVTAFDTVEHKPVIRPS
jgi:hypothetical protein